MRCSQCGQKECCGSDQESELTKLRKRVEVLESALKTLRVAVNDKQPDPGASAFINKALSESAKIAGES